jgi:hypothetical protein
VDHLPLRITRRREIAARERRPAVPSTRLRHLTAAVVRRGIDLPSVRSEQGQTLVEFALILPILLVLVIGIFDFGSAFNSKNDLNFIANTAARYAEVNQCAGCPDHGVTTIRDYVKSTADTRQLGNSLNITFTLPTGSNGAVGDALQVTACAPFNWLGVNLPGLPRGLITLRSSVTVRILQAPNPPASPALYSTGAAC